MKKIIKIIFYLIFISVLITGSYYLYNKVKKIDFNKYSNLLGFNGKGLLIDDYSNLEDSKITGSELSFDTNYYPYYGVLSNNGKELYKQIYANIESTEDTFIPVVEINHTEVVTIIEAVTNDHPELFWIGQEFTYKYTNDGICRQITLKYNNLINNLEVNINKFNQQVNYIVNKASTMGSNYQKEVYVHDVLINKISYNLNASYNQTAYSALVNNSTVCAGYSKAFQYIMQKLGIPTYYVTGVSEGEDHAWNIIYLDGFYNVDLTWDDAASYHYSFFNLTDLEFSGSHQRSILSNYLPSCNSNKYSYNNQNNNQPKEKENKVIKEKEPIEEEIIKEETPKEEEITEEKEKEIVVEPEETEEVESIENE